MLPVLGLLLVISWFGSPLASAHELRPAIATIEFTEGGDLTLGISLNLEAAIAEIGAGHDDTDDSPSASKYNRLRSLSPSVLAIEFDRFGADFLSRVKLLTDKEDVSLTITSVDIPEVGDISLPRISQLSLKGLSPFGIKHVSWRLDPRLGNSVIRVRDVNTSSVLGAEYVLAGETSNALSVEGLLQQSWTSVFINYAEVGFSHIVPKGLDHILFVIGLFLLSTRLSALLWQVTAFTIAHTVTLALAMYGVIELSPALVEPLIAASIIYVAIENIMTDHLHRWRLVLVFCFGLLHGLGFAGVLLEIGSVSGQFVVSLLSFNLGVELGQLSVITVCFLTVGWTMKQKWYRRVVVIPASLGIGVMAAFWFWERINIT